MDFESPGPVKKGSAAVWPDHALLFIRSRSSEVSLTSVSYNRLAYPIHFFRIRIQPYGNFVTGSGDRTISSDKKKHRIRVSVVDSKDQDPKPKYKTFHNFWGVGRQWTACSSREPAPTALVNLRVERPWRFNQCSGGEKKRYFCAAKA